MENAAKSCVIITKTKIKTYIFKIKFLLINSLTIIFMAPDSNNLVKLVNPYYKKSGG